MSNVSYVNPPGSAPAQGLYSHAGIVESGRLAFLAGQLSVGAKGEVVGKNDFATQFNQIFDNLNDVLKGLGVDFNQVIKFTTYMVHSQDIDTFMGLRQERFPKLFRTKDYPPNTLLMINRLVKEEFLLEVEAVVSLGAPKS
jgi:enamine deaminase RidA (YjgF/YER057c/UK114 family)